MSDTKSGENKPVKIPPGPKQWPDYLPGNPTRTSRIGEDPVLEPPLPKVRDVYGRIVSTKKANQPFLAYGRWKAQQAAKEERRKSRAERRARGEAVSDDEGSVDGPPDESMITALGKMVEMVLLILMVAALAGQFITGSPLWGYKGKWTNIHTYLAPFASEKLFTEEQLAKFDGSNPALPIYLAIDGNVYDVSAGKRTYGPGGSYHSMAGKDAARSFGTGCFATHQTHDLRGLDEQEVQSVEHWKKFFANSEKYHQVGRVLHRPIDPSSPIPEHCDEEKRKVQKQQEADAKRPRKAEL